MIGGKGNTLLFAGGGVCPRKGSFWGCADVPRNAPVVWPFYTQKLKYSPKTQYFNFSTCKGYFTGALWNRLAQPPEIYQNGAVEDANVARPKAAEETK